jgi:hypothetical protein
LQVARCPDTVVYSVNICTKHATVAKLQSILVFRVVYDVDASAIGMGCVEPGQLAMVAATAASVRVTERLEPDADANERLDERYRHYRKVIDALEGSWEASGGAV